MFTDTHTCILKHHIHTHGQCAHAHISAHTRLLPLTHSHMITPSHLHAHVPLAPRGLWRRCPTPSAGPSHRAEAGASDVPQGSEPSRPAPLRPGVCQCREGSCIQLGPPLGGLLAAGCFLLPNLTKALDYPHSQISKKPLGGGSMTRQGPGDQAPWTCVPGPPSPLGAGCPQFTLHPPSWCTQGTLRAGQGCLPPAPALHPEAARILHK